MAASTDPADLDQSKRVFPWGSEAPDFSRANTDWRAMGCIDASAFPDGDSAFGCRQMIGNVWEWCSDLYDDGQDNCVLRGGSWDNLSFGLRIADRSFHLPNDADNYFGFRCVVELSEF